MTWLDYAFLGVVVLSVLVGLFRGLVREALSLGTWILAFIIALRYGPQAAVRLESLIHSPVARLVCGYALVFVGALIAGAIVTWLFSLLVRKAGLSPVDRMLGSGFGLLRGALLVVGLVMIAGFTPLHEESWWKSSRLAPQLKPAAAQLQALIPQRWLAYLQSGAGTATAAVAVSKSER